MNYALMAAGGLVLALFMAQFWASRCGKKAAGAIAEKEAQIRALEKQIHEVEKSGMLKLNEAEQEATKRLKQERDRATEEGRILGHQEKEIENQQKILVLKSDLIEQARQDRSVAELDTEQRIRSEFERQSKLFSIQIRPYLRTVTDKGFIRDDYHHEIGYQFQLLVNGLPVFQPHAVVERKETVREIKQEKVDWLLAEARKLAKDAMGMYLGVDAAKIAVLGPDLKVQT